MIDWLLRTTPDFWSAVFTFGLLAVASITAIIGLRGLRTANETLRLESAPYLVVTIAPIGSQVEANEDYVVSSPATKGSTPRLRPREFAVDEPKAGPGVTRSPHCGGRRDWCRNVITIKNVGRSPAVGVRIDATFKFSERPDLDYERISADPQTESANNAPWLPGRDYPLKAGGSGGFGTIETSSIMPGESAFVKIENRYAADVQIEVAKTGTITSLDGTKRITIPVMSPSEPITIRFR